MARYVQYIIYGIAEMGLKFDLPSIALPTVVIATLLLVSFYLAFNTIISLENVICNARLLCVGLGYFCMAFWAQIENCIFPLKRALQALYTTTWPPLRMGQLTT